MKIFFQWGQKSVGRLNRWSNYLVSWSLRSFLSRVDSITKCAEVAQDKEYRYFAVRNGGECVAGPRLQESFKEHGESLECFEGEGGHEAINVYKIRG